MRCASAESERRACQSCAQRSSAPSLHARHSTIKPAQKLLLSCFLAMQHYRLAFQNSFLEKALPDEPMTPCHMMRRFGCALKLGKKSPVSVPTFCGSRALSVKAFAYFLGRACAPAQQRLANRACIQLARAEKLPATCKPTG